MISREVPLDVLQRPFPLRPERPPEGEPRRRLDGETETEVSAAMKERVQAVGLIMRRPQWSPNTIRAHEATAYAREAGMGAEFHHAAFKAYYERGWDLGDAGVLTGIGRECGLDGAELRSRLDSGHHRQQVLDEWQAAKDMDVGGTPTYRIGGQLYKGDVGLEELRSAVKEEVFG